MSREEKMYIFQNLTSPRNNSATVLIERLMLKLALGTVVAYSVVNMEQNSDFKLEHAIESPPGLDALHISWPHSHSF